MTSTRLELALPVMLALPGVSSSFSLADECSASDSLMLQLPQVNTWTLLCSVTRTLPPAPQTRRSD
jgi:hypothetical protein